MAGSVVQKFSEVKHSGLCQLQAVARRLARLELQDGEEQKVTYSVYSFDIISTALPSMIFPPPGQAVGR